MSCGVKSGGKQKDASTNTYLSYTFDRLRCGKSSYLASPHTHPYPYAYPLPWLSSALLFPQLQASSAQNSPYTHHSDTIIFY